MNKPYIYMNQSYVTLMRVYALCKVFIVQIVPKKNKVHALLSCILSIVNSDWLHHPQSVHRVYEWNKIPQQTQ